MKWTRLAKRENLSWHTDARGVLPFTDSDKVAYCIAPHISGYIYLALKIYFPVSMSRVWTSNLVQKESVCVLILHQGTRIVTDFRYDYSAFSQLLSSLFLIIQKI